MKLHILGLLGLWAAGCGGPGGQPAPSRPIEASAWAQRLQPLWDVHGPAAASRSPAGVRFRWRVEAAGASWTLDVGLRAGRDDVAWLFEPAGEPLRVPLAATDLRIHDSALLGLALQALPTTFHLPWALTRGRWELRELLPPPERSEARALEVVPLTARSGVGPFRLQLDAGTGLLARLVLATRHRASGGAPVTVALADYTWTGGLRHAAARTTTLAGPQEVFDPRELLREDAADGGSRTPGTILRETISAVRLLTEEEAELELPLPGDEG
jgi:hypothetical protein